MSAPVAHTPDALHDVSLQKAVAGLNVDLPGRLRRHAGRPVTVLTPAAVAPPVQ